MLQSKSLCDLRLPQVRRGLAEQTPADRALPPTFPPGSSTSLIVPHRKPDRAKSPVFILHSGLTQHPISKKATFSPLFPSPQNKRHFCTQRCCTRQRYVSTCTVKKRPLRRPFVDDGACLYLFSVHLNVNISYMVVTGVLHNLARLLGLVYTYVHVYCLLQRGPLSSLATRSRRVMTPVGGAPRCSPTPRQKTPWSSRGPLP